MPLNPHIKGGADVPILDGGTGASTASGARTNLDALNEAAHDLLDHSGLTGVGDLTTAAHASLDHSTIPHSFLNIGTVTDAAASGDFAAGLTGDSRIVFDQSSGVLRAIRTTTSTNDIDTVLRVFRENTGGTATGFGSCISFAMSDDGGVEVTGGDISSVLTQFSPVETEVQIRPVQSGSTVSAVTVRGSDLGLVTGGPINAGTYARVGSSTAAVAPGDLSTGNGANSLFYNASGNQLQLVGASAIISSDDALTVASGTTDDALTLRSGDNGAGDSGDVTIDAGSATGTAGTVTLAGTNAASLVLGRAGLATSVPGNLTVTGDLTVNGTTTTVDTTNILVEDVLALFAANASTADEAGLAFERGSTGDDSLLLWNEAGTRFELGLFDTSGGTTAPTGALTSLSDLRVNDLLLAGTALTADGALTVTATGATLSLDGSALETSATSLTADGAFTVAATSAVLSLDGSGIETNATSLTADAAISFLSGSGNNALTLKSGDNGAGDSGDVTIDSGTATGTAGDVLVGTTSANAVSVGRSGQATTINGTLTVSEAATFTLAADFDAGATVAAGQAITGDGALTVAATGAVLSLDGSGLETSATTFTADAAFTLASGVSDNALTLRSGNNGAGDSGDVTVDSGTATGTAGDVLIGTTSANAVSIGRSGQATTVNGTLTVTEAATFTASADFDSGATVAAGQSITGDGALTITATGSALSLDGSGLETSSTTLTADAAFTLSSGTADNVLTLKSGDNGAGDSGNVVVDAGTATGTAGDVNVGTTNAANVNVGRAAGSIGFFGATAVGQQTDVGVLTDSSGGSVDGTVAAVSGSGDDTTINNNFADLVDRINGLRTSVRNLGLMA